jgi:hypothetical protein
MDETTLAKQKEAQELATIEKVKSQLAEIRRSEIRRNDFNYQNKISDFIHHTAIPALRKKYGDPKPFSGDMDVHGRILRYKLYHISIGGSGYSNEPYVDLDPDLEGHPSFEKFIDDLYQELVTNKNAEKK